MPAVAALYRYPLKGFTPESRTALTRYLGTLDENPLQGHPERLPLKLVGDATTPRHQDTSAGQVTLHGRGSLAAAGAALGHPQLNELRFCSNIAIAVGDAVTLLDAA